MSHDVIVSINIIIGVIIDCTLLMVEVEAMVGLLPLLLPKPCPRKFCTFFGVRSKDFQLDSMLPIIFTV